MKHSSWRDQRPGIARVDAVKTAYHEHGAVYLRVYKVSNALDGIVYVEPSVIDAVDAGADPLADIRMYHDEPQAARIIGASKVEEAVEHMEYMDICRAEDLNVFYSAQTDRWVVSYYGATTQGISRTLRGAYVNYHKNLRGREELDALTGKGVRDDERHDSRSV